MLPAEPLKAVKEMSDLLYKANVSFWKLKDQMVAAEVPGANQADWSEDLIVLAVQHNFTYDFTRVGLSRPTPKATHVGLSRPTPKATHSGGAAAVALPPPPRATQSVFQGSGGAAADTQLFQGAHDGVIEPILHPLNGPLTPIGVPAKAKSGAVVRVVIQDDTVEEEMVVDSPDKDVQGSGFTCVADSLAKLYEADWTQDLHADFQRGYVFPGTHTAQEIQVVIKDMGHKSSCCFHKTDEYETKVPSPRPVTWTGRVTLLVGGHFPFSYMENGSIKNARSLGVRAASGKPKWSL
jgi:hypothetical protein